MNYAVSDIHGCYDEFRKLLSKINFSKEDTLYILGDIIDRGPDSIKLLEYISLHSNMIPLFGNHDYAAYVLLPKLLQNVTKKSIEEFDDPVWIKILSLWLADGGMETVKEYKKLSKDDQNFYLEFLSDFDVVVEINVNGKDYVLSHSLPSDFHEHPVLNGRDVLDIINGRPDFHAEWNYDKTYVIGHTPTGLIHPDHRKEVFQKNSLINIDCGCVFGGPLAAYCFETESVIY